MLCVISSFIINTGKKTWRRLVVECFVPVIAASGRLIAPRTNRRRADENRVAVPLPLLPFVLKNNNNTDKKGEKTWRLSMYVSRAFLSPLPFGWEPSLWQHASCSQKPLSPQGIYLGFLFWLWSPEKSMWVNTHRKNFLVGDSTCSDSDTLLRPSAWATKRRYCSIAVYYYYYHFFIVSAVCGCVSVFVFAGI